MGEEVVEHGLLDQLGMCFFVDDPACELIGVFAYILGEFGDLCHRFGDGCFQFKIFRIYLLAKMLDQKERLHPRLLEQGLLRRASIAEGM